MVIKLRAGDNIVERHMEMVIKVKGVCVEGTNTMEMVIKLKVRVPILWSAILKTEGGGRVLTLWSTVWK